MKTWTNLLVHACGHCRGGWKAPEPDSEVTPKPGSGGAAAAVAMPASQVAPEASSLEVEVGSSQEPPSTQPHGFQFYDRVLKKEPAFSEVVHLLCSKDEAKSEDDVLEATPQKRTARVLL